MTTRDELVEQGVAAILPLYIAEDRQANAFDYVLVKAVLDAILPQVGTVEEVAALPESTWLIGITSYGGFATYQVVGGRLDCGGRLMPPAVALRHDSPLTVVWRPS
jgi:hypothetical protein